MTPEERAKAIVDEIYRILSEDPMPNFTYGSAKPLMVRLIARGLEEALRAGCASEIARLNDTLKNTEWMLDQDRTTLNAEIARLRAALEDIAER